MNKTEKTIKRAFSAAAPDVLDAVLKKCTDRKEQVIEMTERKKHIFLIRVAVIAAAIALLSVTVTAAISFSGVQSREDAINAALSYAVRADEAGDAIAVLWDTQNASENEAVLGEANLRFSVSRPVYNIHIKVPGVSVDCVVDAKTLVVLDGNVTREDGFTTEKIIAEAAKAAEDWFEKPQNAEQKEPVPEKAIYTFIDYFGLHPSLCGNREAICVNTSSLSTGGYMISEDFDGYRYTLTVNSETFEPENPVVTEIKGYKGEKVLHEKVEGIITLVEAVEIAGKDMGAEDIWNGSVKTLANYIDKINLSGFSGYAYTVRIDTTDYIYDYTINAVSGEIIESDKIYGYGKIKEFVAEYLGISPEEFKYWSAGDLPEGNWQFNTEIGGIGYRLIIDAHTGEILSEQSEDLPEYKDRFSLSSAAPEGLISEADAMAAALEHFGLSIKKPIARLEIELSEGVYNIRWELNHLTNEEASNVTYLCEIDAETAEVISASPETVHPDLSDTSEFIGEEKAIKIAEGFTNVQNLIETKIDEQCVYADNERVEYAAVYAVWFDVNPNDRYIDCVVVDAKTGEIYGHRHDDPAFLELY